MPKEIPIPKDPTPVVVDQPIEVTPGDGPSVLVFHLAPRNNGLLFSQKGSNVTFSYSSQAPMRLGIYGPDPKHIGAKGRMCAPKAQEPEIENSRCQGNFAPGTYYLVMRSNNDDPPGSPFTLSITAGAWKVFS